MFTANNARENMAKKKLDDISEILKEIEEESGNGKDYTNWYGELSYTQESMLKLLGFNVSRSNSCITIDWEVQE